MNEDSKMVESQKTLRIGIIGAENVGLALALASFKKDFLFLEFCLYLD